MNGFLAYLLAKKCAENLALGGATQIPGPPGAVAHLTDPDAHSALFAEKYQKPANGIPKSDLDVAAQASLGKADTALQSLSQVSYKSHSLSGGVTLNCALYNNGLVSYRFVFTNNQITSNLVGGSYIGDVDIAYRPQENQTVFIQNTSTGATIGYFSININGRVSNGPPLSTGTSMETMSLTTIARI
jgi:hypothetical protein